MHLPSVADLAGRIAKVSRLDSTSNGIATCNSDDSDDKTLPK